MSDAGRKSFTDKASESMKPDSQKSYMEKGKEYLTDTYDRAAGATQPESDKGLGQSVADSSRTGKDKANVETNTESMTETMGEYYDSAKNKVNEAVEFVSNKMHGGSGAATEHDLKNKK